jgi:hypothetical protein
MFRDKSSLVIWSIASAWQIIWTVEETAVRRTAANAKQRE